MISYRTVKCEVVIVCVSRGRFQQLYLSLPYNFTKYRKVDGSSSSTWPVQATFNFLNIEGVELIEGRVLDDDDGA